MADRTQINYALDTKKIEKLSKKGLGPNWYNVVLDINEFLTKKGFKYSRTLGFVNDCVLSQEELSEIVTEMYELGLDKKNFLYIECAEVGNIMDLTTSLKGE